MQLGQNVRCLKKKKRFFLIIWIHFFLEGFIILSKPGLKPLCNLLIWDCHLHLHVCLYVRIAVCTQMDGAPGAVNQELSVLTGRELRLCPPRDKGVRRERHQGLVQITKGSGVTTLVCRWMER